MVPTSQQHLFSLDNVMYTKAQQKHDCWGCHHGHRHFYSADAWSPMFPSPKGIVRDNIYQNEVTWTSSVFLHCTEYRLFALFHL